jgi:outer membrane lipoprotein-sorting protein
MRRFTLVSVAAAFALAVAAPSSLRAAAPSHEGAGPVPVHFSDAEKADLQRVSAYLNSLKSIQGRFTQIAGNGRSVQGTFYLRKPGRVRFEYEKPNPTLIVADGTTVAVMNANLKTTDRYPLLNSPLRLLLSDNIDLANDSHISAIKREQGALTVTARENAGAAIGRVTLSFADSGSSLELRQWDVVDGAGSHTAVAVNEMREVADIPPRLFVIEDLSPFKKTER